MITIAIPSRSERRPDGTPGPDERFLHNTVADLLANARGEIEIIVCLDGYWPDPLPPADPRVQYIHWGESRGMRPGINAVAEIAHGEHIMKCDAHCAFAPGFDLELVRASESNMVQIPRRYSLDAELWERKPKRPTDYMYLSFPDNPNDWGGPGYHGRAWPEKDRDPELAKIEIDDNMSFQGSCWFMPLAYFRHLGLMDVARYGTFFQEAQDIGFKTWFDGGRVVRNKRTWYAHLHKGRQYGRGYRISHSEFGRAVRASFDEVKQNRPAMVKYVERFWPVPGWPENWQEVVFAK